ncbi:MAG: hypothetical protein ACKOXF_09445 [Chitinophagaceae bacterium]
MLILVFSSCQYKPESVLVAGQWKYTSVEKHSESLFSIGDNDVMILQKDSAFEYHINSVNKHMYGKWSYSDHTLHLKYAEPDTTRHFKVDLLSDHLLKMHEGDVNFSFTRVKTD